MKKLKKVNMLSKVMKGMSLVVLEITDPLLLTIFAAHLLDDGPNPLS